MNKENYAKDIKRSFIEIIKKYMKEENIIKTDFCKKLGITRAMLNRILDENNSSLTINTIVKISEIIGVKPILYFEE